MKRTHRRVPCESVRECVGDLKYVTRHLNRSTSRERRQFASGHDTLTATCEGHLKERGLQTLLSGVEAF